MSHSTSSSGGVSSPTPSLDEDTGVLPALPGAQWTIMDLLLKAKCPATPRMAMREHMLQLVQPHQREAVRSCSHIDVEGQNSVQSGVLTLPCGSGKTLIGVLLVTLARVKTLIVAQTVEQIHQWRQTLLKWTTIHNEDILFWKE